MERQRPEAGQVISGTHGFIWWDNDILYEVTSFEAKLKTVRETVNFAGDMWSDSKLMGVEGTYSVKLKKVFSRSKEYAEAIAAGKDKRLTLIAKLDDPDVRGAERVRFDNCWLDELPIAAFEHGKLIEDDYSGGFKGLEYLDSIPDPLRR